MKKFYIYAYSMASKGANMLKEELGCSLIKREGSSFVPGTDKIVINWGASDCPPQYNALNKTVKAALNKKDFYERLKDTGCVPPFATSKIEAAATLKFPVFCRTKLEGKDGEGIKIAEKWNDLVEAKLYTQFIDKTSEYRIHVGRGPTGFVIIGAQKKIKKAAPDGENIPSDTRIWGGDVYGLVWKSGGAPVLVPAPVKEVVQKAFEKFPEFTFLAFDVIFDNSAGKAYVLEANTAPMGTPETAKRYADFFRSLYPEAVVQTPASTPVPASSSGGAPAQVGSPLTKSPALPVITIEQVKAAQTILNAYINQHS
jgi:hypothetical protein